MGICVYSIYNMFCISHQDAIDEAFIQRLPLHFLAMLAELLHDLHCISTCTM